MPEPEVVGSPFMSSLIFFFLPHKLVFVIMGWLQLFSEEEFCFFLLNQLCPSVSAQSDPSLS